MRIDTSNCKRPFSVKNQRTKKLKPAFRNLFQNFETARKQRSKTRDSHSRFLNLQHIKGDLDRAKYYIDNLHEEKSKLKRTL